jgi:hypothetical protein
MIAPGLRGLTHNHCNSAQIDCNWDRNRRGRAHTDCTGLRVGAGKQTTVFLPASCDDRAHGSDVCDPGCNQFALICSDLAPVRIRQLQ